MQPEHHPLVRVKRTGTLAPSSCVSGALWEPGFPPAVATLGNTPLRDNFLRLARIT